MIFKNINRWDIIKMSDNIIPSSNCIWEKTYSCILKNGILFHEMYYYNYYFDCTKVCGGNTILFVIVGRGREGGNFNKRVGWNKMSRS